MLDLAYVKTERGRAEIKARALPLSRSLRNLLLMVDEGKTGRDWLGLIQGISEADLLYLIEQGLIAPAGGPAAAASAAAALAPEPASPGNDLAGRPLPALSTLDYQTLYAYLTGNAKKHLGLIKGYRTVLEVERCGDIAALQQLAQRFVEEVQQAEGMGAAERVRRDLGMLR